MDEWAEGGGMRRVMMVVGLLVALVLAGCGDSGKETDTADSDDTTEVTDAVTDTTVAATVTNEAEAGGTLEGTYELTGPEPGLYECSFATEQLVMYVSGDQVTIDEADGP